MAAEDYQFIYLPPPTGIKIPLDVADYLERLKESVGLLCVLAQRRCAQGILDSMFVDVSNALLSAAEILRGEVPDLGDYRTAETMRDLASTVVDVIDDENRDTKVEVEMHHLAAAMRMIAGALAAHEIEIEERVERRA